MKLSEGDVELFYKLHPALLSYANQKLKVLEGGLSPGGIVALPVEERMKVRDALYDNLSLIDSFAKENPPGFSAEELEIVRSWKHLVRGRFFLIKHLKRHSIFLDEETPPHAYGVLGLQDSLKDMFEWLPVILEAVLLPFKDRIIYDGMVKTYRVFSGPGVRRGLEEEYREAKLRYGVITALPFQEEERKVSDEERLRVYLRSKDSRERHWEEIWELIEENPGLLTVYHHEMGKHDARSYGRQLRKIGLRDAWFALLEGLIVASGRTRKEVEEILEDILPEEKRDFAYVFHLKR